MGLTSSRQCKEVDDNASIFRDKSIENDQIQPRAVQSLHMDSTIVERIRKQQLS